MCKLFVKWLAFAMMLLVSVASQAQYAARVTLDGDWYLQQGAVENFTPGVDIVGMRYSMGALEDGTAVFQTFRANDTPEGFLFQGSDRYQVSGWAFDIAGNQQFSFSGLDLDILSNTTTMFVDDQTIDRVGSSLRNAYVELTFADGFYKVLHLNQTGWDVTQVLEFGAVPVVPEPSGWSLLLLGGLFVFACKRWGFKIEV